MRGAYPSRRRDMRLYAAIKFGHVVNYRDSSSATGMLKGEYEELQNRSEGVSDALVSETPAQEFSQLSETPAQEFSQLDATLLRLGGR